MQSTDIAGAGGWGGIPAGVARPPTGRTWVIVLAGGEGTRLADVTRDEAGVAVPKQYCSFDGWRTLLGATLDRAGRFAPPQRQVVVVAGAHVRWWAGELAHLPRENVLVQPVGRGTAAGLLLPLLHVLRRDPAAQVLVLPSDQHVAEEDVLAHSVRLAGAASRVHGGRPVLLGIEPDRPDEGYGWIVPGPDLEISRRILAFVEKPARARAVALLEQGAVWSSFMLTSSVRGLLACYDRALPALLAAFQEGLEAAGSRTGAALRRLYEGLPSFDFSRHVLESCPDEARVLPVPWCGWSDLGTPERVAACPGLRGPLVLRAREQLRGAVSAAEAVTRAG